MADPTSTRAVQLAALQTELATVKTQIATLRSSASSFSIGEMSVTQYRLNDLAAEQTRIEKSIQRLVRGGRGIVVDMSYEATSDGDPRNDEWIERGT